MPLSGILASEIMPGEPGTSKNETKKRKQDDSNYVINVSTKNSYEPLSDSESMDEDDPSPGKVNEIPLVKKPVKIPPIVVYSYIKNHSESIKLFKKSCKQDFDIKCRGNRLIFLAKCKEDYNKIINEVASAKLEYHTYTPSDEINNTLVLRNIPPNVTCEEISQDLSDRNIRPIKITQMSKKEASGQTVKFPMFIVTFDKTVNIKDVVANNKVCSCLVNWERYKNFSGVTQCYKCQSFNHIAKNCYRQPKCLKCAGSHLTLNCTSPPESTPLCANCGGSHPANHQSCYILQKNTKARPSLATHSQKISKNSFQLNSTDFPSLPKSSYSNIAASSSSVWGSSPGPNKISSSASLPHKTTTIDSAQDFSMSSLINEIKFLFSAFNFSNILSKLKVSLENLKQAPDSLSKISIIADFIFNLI